MPQSRIYTEADRETANRLRAVFEEAFEDAGLPVSAFEVPENPELWSISVYAETDDAEEIRATMASIAKEQSFSVAFEREDIVEQDWVAATLRDLTAVRAGGFVVHGSHEMDAVKPHETGILIDAGLAFGTGHHGTTAGCLDMLSEAAKKRDFYNILDLGTGSGVLGIAAAKALRARVLGSDIDPVATETANFNVQRNGVQARMDCVTAAGFTHRAISGAAPFDLVIANILAKPLKAMAHDVSLHTMPGGTIILSGLLPHQRRMIVGTFRQHNIMFEKAYIRDGWLTLVLSKP